MTHTNIDVSAKNTCLHAKTYQNILLGLDLKNIISRPTRITNTSATIIDHIITNLPYNSIQSGILFSNITDLLPVLGFFNLSLNTRYFRPEYYRTYLSSKKNDFVDVFSNNISLLHPDSNDFDPDVYLDNVIKAINSAVDKVFPLRKRSKKQLKSLKTPG